MTKDEFEIYYAKGSDLSVEQLREYGITIEPCDCGAEGCFGWQAVTQRQKSSLPKD